MDKFVEILKELFELVRRLVAGLIAIAVPLLRAAWTGACKGWALARKYGGPTARLIWKYLGPALRKASIPFVWLGTRIWRRIGPWVKAAGKWLLKYLGIGARFLFGRLSRTPVLRKAEKRLLSEQLGDDEVAWLVRTRTKVDVGLWFRKRKVWCCLAARRLVLFACGKFPVTCSIPVGELKKTRYNHITGELILSPAENAGVRCLRMPPLDAFELLSQIRDDTDVDSWSISLDEHLDELERAEDGGPVLRTMGDMGNMAPAK